MSEYVQRTQKAGKQTKVGITCPDCGAKTRVYYTRSVEGAKVQRMRICNHCERRIITYEFAIGVDSGSQKSCTLGCIDMDVAIEGRRVRLLPMLDTQEPVHRRIDRCRATLRYPNGPMLLDVRKGNFSNDSGFFGVYGRAKNAD